MGSTKVFGKANDIVDSRNLPKKAFMELLKKVGSYFFNKWFNKVTVIKTIVYWKYEVNTGVIVGYTPVFNSTVYVTIKGEVTERKIYEQAVNIYNDDLVTVIKVVVDDIQFPQFKEVQNVR